MEAKKVLIVEDSAEKVERTIRILKKKKLNYEVATCIDVAISKVKNTKFDYWIVDFCVPMSEKEPQKKGRNGFDMLLKLAEEGIRTPTFVYSYCPISDDNREKLKEAGVLIVTHVIDDDALEAHLEAELVKSK